MTKYPVVVLPFLRVAAMAIFPFIFIKSAYLRTNETLIRHEVIHLRQQLELLIFPFYLLYLINYLVNLARYTNHHQAYRQIVFEREAYANEQDARYLTHRRFWAWLRYI